MTPRNVPNGISHSQYRQAEGERNAMQADADFRKSGRQYGAATTAQDKPEGSNQFCTKFIYNGWVVG